MKIHWHPWKDHLEVRETAKFEIHVLIHVISGDIALQFAEFHKACMADMQMFELRHRR